MKRIVPTKPLPPPAQRDARRGAIARCDMLATAPCAPGVDIAPSTDTDLAAMAAAARELFGPDATTDYTIIGGAVNLASRLEQEASPGTVLISYETFAQVKDTIDCDELGHIHVKGIAYPVATYRVVDLKANLVATHRAVRTELPHLRLEAEPDLMSADERGQAATALRDMLDRLCHKPG